MNPEQKSQPSEPVQEPTERTKDRIITYTDAYGDKVAGFFGEMEREFPEVAGVPDIKDIPQWYQGNDRSNFWMTVDGENEILGTAGLRTADRPEVGYLSRLYVRKDSRSRGVGKELAEAQIKFAKEHGYKKLFAATMPGNERAHKFDRKLGFKEVKNPPSDWKFSDGTVFFEMDLEGGQK